MLIIYATKLQVSRLTCDTQAAERRSTQVDGSALSPDLPQETVCLAYGNLRNLWSAAEKLFVPIGSRLSLQAECEPVFDCGREKWRATVRAKGYFRET